MDYRQEIQRIADRLKTDRGVDPKWRNKLTARLEEIAAMTHMLTGAQPAARPAQQNLDQIANGMSQTTISQPTEIPPLLKGFQRPLS